MSLGTRLRKARKLKNWTQAQLEDAAGVKQATISQIEREDQERTIYIVDLAHALDVSVEWLAEGTLPITPPSTAHMNWSLNPRLYTAPKYRPQLRES